MNSGKICKEQLSLFADSSEEKCQFYRFCRIWALNVMDSRIHDKVQEAFEMGAYFPAPFSLLHPHSIFRIKVIERIFLPRVDEF